MSISNPIYKALETKEDLTTYPAMLDNSISEIIDGKEHEYDDIIRMNTSDRNKAKSTISVLNTVYYQANTTLQLLYSVFKEELDDISSDEYNYIVEHTTSLFKECDIVIYERGRTVGPDQGNSTNISTFVLEFVNLYAELLKAIISINKVVYDLSNVVDTIVHGELSSVLLYKDAYPYPNSKLVTAYIDHLYFVNNNLRDNPITYLKNLLEFNDKLDE